MIDIFQGVSLKNTIAEAQITAAKTGDTIVDTAGYNSVALVVCPSTVGTTTADNYFKFNVYTGSESDLGDGANLAAADFSDGAVPAPTSLTAATPVIYPISAQSHKRYMRCNMADAAGTGADVTLSVFFLLGSPRTEPV